MQIDPFLECIRDKLDRKESLSLEDGMQLYACPDLTGLGYLANEVRERKNGDNTYYVVNLHINYTDVCINRCGFCAYSKDQDEEGAFTLTVEDILEKARTQMPDGATEIHIVGGLHPDLPFEYYRDMLLGLKELYPTVHIQAFTAVEIAHIADVSGMSIIQTLEKLREAGLGSLPGGGAEIFDPEIRQVMCPKKLSGRAWIRVTGTAHTLGIQSNATMLYGHKENPRQRIEHMIQLRELQDVTGGFMSFIPLAFHSRGTQFEDIPPTSGILDLKTLAISRLMLDNFDHIKAFWIMLGLKMAQVSLALGIDDLDGTVTEEKITHSAGAATPQRLSVSEIKRLIREAGRIPVERDTVYRTENLKKVHVKN